jgi:predicted metal-dependent hydrolase
MRDDKWLFSKLDEVWDSMFPDVPQDNEVRIVWGRKARNRLGSIRAGENDNSKHPETVITINSLFRDDKIPEFVVIGTIAHELAHYTHGFHSPLEKRFETPHAGGVVRRELKNRGLEEILKRQKKWLKENWENYLAEKFPRKRRMRKRVIIKWI